MVGLREALAVVLGAGIGVLFVAAPEFVARVYTVGRLPSGRESPYGEAASLPPTWRRAVQAVGVLFVLGAALVGALAVGWL